MLPPQHEQRERERERETTYMFSGILVPTPESTSFAQSKKEMLEKEASPDPLCSF